MGESTAPLLLAFPLASAALKLRHSAAELASFLKSNGAKRALRSRHFAHARERSVLSARGAGGGAMVEVTVGKLPKGRRATGDLAVVGA